MQNFMPSSKMIKDAITSLEEKHYQQSFKTKQITYEIMREHLPREKIYRLTENEKRLIEHRVRMVLKKEEATTGLIRNISFKDNVSLWKLVSQEQLNKEASERKSLQQRRQKVWDFCQKADVNAEDVGCGNRVDMSIDDFEKLINFYG